MTADQPTTPVPTSLEPPQGQRLPRGIFANRNMNLRSIAAIGYDMDYTLVHYHYGEWEHRAYSHLREILLEWGWPVEELAFDPDLVTRGLVIDKELGNLLKCDGFGYVKRAAHGVRMLEYQARRAIYSRVVVELTDPRFAFLNTLFSLSEGCMFSQLVELLDAHELPEVMGYADLYSRVRQAIDEAHMEGRLKQEIVAAPDRYVQLDPDAPLALIDQRRAGKKLLLITNSDWWYTNEMMKYAYGRFLPEDTAWEDLFDLIICSARKPDFFSGFAPAFEVVSGDGLLRPHVHGSLDGAVYVGGNVHLVEKHLGLSGKEILYVGDHISSDVHASKSLLRWRTALVLRELEDEVAELERFREQQATLTEKMGRKRRHEFRYSQLRLQLQRAKLGYGPGEPPVAAQLERELRVVRDQIQTLDEEIAPLARASGKLCNARWGPLMRAGKDISVLAREVEQHADIYTSRVANFLAYTPFSYFRSPRGTMPHDLGWGETDWSGTPQDEGDDGA